ncbi:hypothetical protein PsorP6_008088 [Peronosclerospora sorghi]|uniref:Uncharacterized protein n=1 Tax=Peronosclerospora sorghi TaxID=230839 RepID=A0ACC0WBQ5_9STRA|nr:hypothetical protein PsorP6_008088 [Peronosclerospora sorghi]
MQLAQGIGDQKASSRILATQWPALMAQQNNHVGLRCDKATVTQHFSPRSDHYLCSRFCHDSQRVVCCIMTNQRTKSLKMHVSWNSSVERKCYNIKRNAAVRTTHFDFQEVPEEEKERMRASIFHNVTNGWISDIFDI